MFSGVLRGRPGHAFRRLFQVVPGVLVLVPVCPRYQISGAKHSPLSSDVWWHHIVEFQVSRYYRNCDKNLHTFLNLRISGISTLEFQINENSIIIVGSIW